MNQPEHPLSSKAAFLRWSESIGLYESDSSSKFPAAYDTEVMVPSTSHFRFMISPRETRLDIYAIWNTAANEQLASWKSYIIERPELGVIDRRSRTERCGLCSSVIMTNDNMAPVCYACQRRRQQIANCRSAVVLFGTCASVLNADCVSCIRVILARIVRQILLEMPCSMIR